MQKRAFNGVVTAVTGAALAGGLATGLSVASESVPEPTPAANTTIAQDTTAQDTATKAAASVKKAAKKTTKMKAAKADKKASKVLLSGTTTSSYFWDDGSGINGDTGAPASGKPMQKGAFASPSWPLDTKVKVTYQGRTATGFIGDRGPGEPSHRGVMLDLDTYTFRHLIDGQQPESKYNTGTDEGHLNGVKWEVIEWGDGPGKGQPKPLG
jgi:hypothetical protein